jgi:hypothetical protein
MPFARLMAPVLPTFAWLLAERADDSRGTRSRWKAWLEALALPALVFFQWRSLPEGRAVLASRQRLAREAAPSLGGTIATVDVGWPTLVSDAKLIDLSGVTDRDVAYLPGGHTSKRIPDSLVLQADTLLLYAYSEGSAFEESVFPRVTEARLARSQTLPQHFPTRTWVPLAKGAGYWILRK